MGNMLSCVKRETGFELTDPENYNLEEIQRINLEQIQCIQRDSRGNDKLHMTNTKCLIARSVDEIQAVRAPVRTAVKSVKATDIEEDRHRTLYKSCDNNKRKQIEEEEEEKEKEKEKDHGEVRKQMKKPKIKRKIHTHLGDNFYFNDEYTETHEHKNEIKNIDSHCHPKDATNKLNARLTYNRIYKHEYDLETKKQIIRIDGRRYLFTEFIKSNKITNVKTIRNTNNTNLDGDNGDNNNGNLDLFNEKNENLGDDNGKDKDNTIEESKNQENQENSTNSNERKLIHSLTYEILPNKADIIADKEIIIEEIKILGLFNDNNNNNNNNDIIDGNKISITDNIQNITNKIDINILRNFLIKIHNHRNFIKHIRLDLYSNLNNTNEEDYVNISKSRLGSDELENYRIKYVENSNKDFIANNPSNIKVKTLEKDGDKLNQYRIKHILCNRFKERVLSNEIKLNNTRTRTNNISSLDLLGLHQLKNITNKELNEELFKDILADINKDNNNILPFITARSFKYSYTSNSYKNSNAANISRLYKEIQEENKLENKTTNNTSNSLFAKIELDEEELYLYRTKYYNTKNLLVKLLEEIKHKDTKDDIINNHIRYNTIENLEELYRIIIQNKNFIQDIVLDYVDKPEYFIIEKNQENKISNDHHEQNNDIDKDKDIHHKPIHKPKNYFPHNYTNILNISILYEIEVSPYDINKDCISKLEKSSITLKYNLNKYYEKDKLISKDEYNRINFNSINNSSNTIEMHNIHKRIIQANRFKNYVYKGYIVLNNSPSYNSILDSKYNHIEINNIADTLRK